MKDYCEQCLGSTNHQVLFSQKIAGNIDNDLYWNENYETIQCKGCDNIQFRITYSDDTMVDWDEDTEEQFYFNEKTYYPLNIQNHKRLKNFHYIPEKIRIVYNETLEALKSKCYLLTGVGLRSIIEAICLDRKISGRNLKLKINNLTKNKLITENDAHRLHSIRFLGNDSVHEMEMPSESKIRVALSIAEHLISNLYLIDIDANQHLDTMISNYETFKSLVLKRFRAPEINVGDEKSIKEILEKDFRRIEAAYLSNFTQKLMDEIKNNTIQILEIGELKKSSIENVDVQHFIKKEINIES